MGTETGGRKFISMNLCSSPNKGSVDLGDLKIHLLIWAWTMSMSGIPTVVSICLLTKIRLWELYLGLRKTGFCGFGCIKMIQ